ncbi:hypothetical protein, partial [Bacillus sp. T2.9-1]|uniref:hypothetical protein n=1 Tax=Bacillus sp. T2.9-1 TaxID=3041163 RepID=UPI002540EAEE
CCKLIHREDLFSRIGCGDLILPREGLPFYMEIFIYTKYFILSENTNTFKIFNGIFTIFYNIADREFTILLDERL